VTAPPAVLHVAQPTDGGVGRYVATVAADQRARGWAVTVACPPEGWLPATLAAAGVPSLSWPAAREPGPASSAEVLRLCGLVAAVRPDVVHLHSSKAGLAGRLALRGRRRTLFQPHGWSWLATAGSRALATLRWERFAAARWTDVQLCVGEDEAEAGRAARLAGPYEVVRNGVNLEWFSARDRPAARLELACRRTHRLWSASAG
jgi:glycosyltransferase involved in cell wall biosynthesis